MDDASRSAVRRHWTASDEEARAYLQERLALLYRIMFWAYAFLIGTQAALWTLTSFKHPAGQNGIYVVATAGLFLMAAVWRGLLVRRTLSVKGLDRIDTRVEPGLEAILMRCLRKAPADRFTTAAEMAEALEALPHAADWDLAGARLWWKEFQAREAEVEAASSTPTATITVNLGDRE